ncbi:hypothetical protein HNQ68_002309 [Pseudochrobactrum saccharolyticum]|uniref:Uncharacterized protein n=1 Tax=Pseudochrobactrum saccharolyticum TaxID=354352 RepID=A0A7W8EQL3_9HYPH|nr:hypothetical protein [Pseudochrobactrum saccharolyticum]
MTFLEFTFQSFWHFIGIVILMWLALAGIAWIAAAARGK